MELSQTQGTEMFATSQPSCHTQEQDPGVLYLGRYINVCAVHRIDLKLDIMSANTSWWTEGSHGILSKEQAGYRQQQKKLKILCSNLKGGTASAAQLCPKK